MNIDLYFVYPISEACKGKLQKFMDHLVAQGLTANRPPSIWFPGINEETSDKISMLRRDYDLRDYGHA